MEKFPALRTGIIERLLQSFSEMKTGRVFRGALWIIGEYALDIAGEFFSVIVACYFHILLKYGLLSAIDMAMAQIRESLGEVPILAAEQVSYNVWGV